MTEEKNSRVRLGEEHEFIGKRAWDPETDGFGKHSYFHVDPETVNPEDYARNLRGEEQHFGDVREFNSADNEKHPDNDVTVDDLSRPGTVVEVDRGEGDELTGEWEVVGLPTTHEGKIRAAMKKKNLPTVSLRYVDMVELGCVVDKENLFQQVATKLVSRPRLGKKQRERLTKK